MIVRDLLKDFYWGKSLYRCYCNNKKMSKIQYMLKNGLKFHVVKSDASKAQQLSKLFSEVKIVPIKNKSFFYSIDCFKTCELQKHILDNYSVDYSIVVNRSFKELQGIIDEHPGEIFYSDEKLIIESLRKYVERCRKDSAISVKYKIALDECESLFERPSKHFHEALQRILFFNQFLWQTRHKHNGFGHLDFLLYDLYKKDLESGEISDDEANEMLKDFFRVLHENCWFKSTMLLGDTGQIIILGGVGENGEYRYNELTYKFIDISHELALPDPKLLLRCSSKMPEALLKSALECIASGIGTPFLSNDDIIIPELIKFGYSVTDSYNYATSACWEPLILNHSCDQNNIQSINFAVPLVEMLDEADLGSVDSKEGFIMLYRNYLEKYLDSVLSKLSNLVFEEEPLISLLSESAFKFGKDIVRGGAEYSNLGLTSVGMSTVVNSIINVERLSFIEKKYSLEELNTIRKNNFNGNEDLVKMLKTICPHYGNDDNEVIQLTSEIQDMTSEFFGKYHTYYGGKFKFGLSSPNYIEDARNTGATLDGRKNGEPFSVHISSNQPLPITELLSFAMKLDYSGNRINGNVVDFMVTPSFLKDNINKFILLMKASFKGGIYQCQMNVIDSTTLIAARENPELFPNLIVRVWGFSAYFKDLPQEYKDLLIERAIASEKAA